ncbi:MAG TPA: alpha/beta hydrolase [Micropepsaceae bacterium]|nr:alpha/beta hydrolase [Micropepsaceae bacterium]
MTTAPTDLFHATMTDGATILIRRGGNPDGIRLFLSHGNGFAIDGYRVFWDPLLEQFDVILFDMRNHGRNQLAGGDGHNYLQFAKDIGSVFDVVDRRLGHRQSVGIFHSMSGRSAMKHAVQMEWVWDALVLFDPPDVPPLHHEQYESMRAFELRLMAWALERQERFTSPTELRQSFDNNRAQVRWQEQSRADMANAILRESGDGGYVLSCRREFEASIYLAALTLDLWPRASEYGGPVKLIGADPNLNYAPATAAANRALAADGGYDYDFVPDTGHLLQVEKPDACREVVLNFLRKHSLA